MGETKATDMKVQFDGRTRLQFDGAKVTSDAELLAVRELGRAWGPRGSNSGQQIVAY